MRPRVASSGPGASSIRAGIDRRLFREVKKAFMLAVQCDVRHIST
jgi:hypothetical protein